MPLPRNMSIRHKQKFIIMLTSAVTVLLACAAFVAYDTAMFRREMTENVSSLAEVIGNSCTAAIDFNDPASAEEKLTALRGEPNIVAARIQTLNPTFDGEPFATYLREGAQQPEASPHTLQAHHEFRDNHLHLFRPITQGGEQIGTIELIANLNELRERLWRYASIVAIVYVASLLAAFWLSSRLERVVSGPILHLSQVARSVTLEKNYSIRATKTSRDELGQLMDDFNEMLAEIQERDAALSAARDNLELRVEERTAELAGSFSLLNATLESTADGILVVNQQGRITSLNKKFAEMWHLSGDQIATRDDDRVLAEVLAQLKEPDAFLSKVRELYAQPEAESRDLLEFADGRVFERYSQPQRLGERCVGRVWSFRDITERKQAEEALRESEALYYSLVDQMPAGVFRKNKEGRYVFVNSGFCRIKGMDAEQILGKTPREQVAYGLASQNVKNPEAARETKWAILGASHHELIIQTGKPIEVEEDYPGVDGKTQYLHVVKSPVFGADGTIIGTQGMLFDITERKRAEAELAYERHLLRTLLDNSTDHIYFKDAQSRFIRSSKAQARQFGVASPDELVGKSDFDFFTEEHARIAYENEQQIIRTGQPMIGKVERESWKDGREETWVLTTKMPFLNKDGEIIGTFGISKDITALKEAEAKLEHERYLLHALLESVPDAIYFKDRESRFIRTSSAMAKLFNLREADELIGRSDFDFFAEEHARPAFEDEQQIIRTGKPMIGKTEKEILPDGRVSWALTSKLPLRNVRGEIIGTLGISKDITAIKEAEAQIEAAHKELVRTSRLAGMAEVATSVLHNVGNVLNSVNTSASVMADRLQKMKISGVSSLLEMFEKNRNDLAGFLSQNNQVDRLLTYLRSLAQVLVTERAAMLGELQELTRNIEHIKEIVAMQQSYAKVSGVTEILSVPVLVEDALRMNEAGLARHEVRVVRNYQNVPDIALDKHKVLQILVNLISNAKYAMPENGTVERILTVGVSMNDDNRIRVSVTDNGIGIAPENLTRIFSHGFTTRHDGHGFGLHSGALAAKEMGGALSVHSDGPGRGATFTLELPAEPAPGLANIRAGESST
jgi:PAS domain S-box-containing protein